MIDLTTYALLRKQITTAASGVSDVRAEGDELVFVLADGHEVRVAIPATEIRDAVVRDDVLVLTLEDDKEVVVDTTLTQSGQAADAKVTGDVVSQLKGDMAGKLPKSPADWASWTAEEQAAARERIGLDKPFELIETITIDEESVNIVKRDAEPDGTAYNFESMMVKVTSFNTNMSGLFRTIFAHKTDEFKFDYNYSAIYFNSGYNDLYVLCEKRNGIWNIESIISHTNGVVRGYYAQPDVVNMDKNIITGVSLYFSSSHFIVGSEIKIYGVRA